MRSPCPTPEMPARATDTSQRSHPMPQSVQITVPSAQSQGLIGQIQRIEGVTGLRLIRDASLKPPGDVIGVEVTVRSLHDLMRLLDEQGVGRESGTSVVTSSPSSVVSSSAVEQITNDRAELTWEEMEVTMGRESNMTANGVATMCVSGAVATFGIATGAVHLVIGAMVIAPGFEPLTRIAMGLVSGSQAWRRGLRHATIAYAALLLSAMLTAVLLRVTGYEALDAGSSYLTANALVSYWTTITFPSVAASAAAAVAGAILVAAGRAVLTGGVMIALALIPSMTVLGMAVVAGNWTLAAAGGTRWLIDVTCVLLLSLLVLGWKRKSIHRRTSGL